MATAELLSDSTALAVVEQKDVQTIFTTSGAFDKILEKIAKEARSFVADASTPSGRKEIASIAFKVAKTKTYLDGLGKDLADQLKDLPKKVDANRKSMRDFLDNLKDEVRKPLTEWEKEQERIEAQRLEEEKKIQLQIQIERDHELAVFMNADFDRRKAESLKAVEQARVDELARIAKEAADRATKEAEERAAAERAAASRREVEAKLAAERSEREKTEAIQRAQAAEAREAQAKQEAAQREELARFEAVRREQERVAEVQLKAKEEQEKREADVKHRMAINSDIANDLVLLGINHDTAILLVDSLSQGKVRHVTVIY